jgi:predicted dehydrogenase
VVLSPTYRAIRARIESGEIGRPLLARCVYGTRGPGWAEWFYRRGGGGALFDLAVYNLTSLTGLLGPARRVAAMAGVALPDRELEAGPVRADAVDNAQILLDFGDELFASVTTGYTIQAYRAPAVEVYGSEGTIQMLGEDWAPNGYELWRADVGEWQAVPESDPGWHWTAGLAHLVACIRDGAELEVTPEHAHHVLEIIVRAEEAAADGRARELETAF